MDKDTRSAIERATQQARRLLEDDFAAQLEGTFDVLRTGEIAPHAGKHLKARETVQRNKIVAAIERKRATGMNAVEAVGDYRREAAFTTLNRFVALKVLEARELVQECITKREQSSGYREFCGLAPGVELLPDRDGYRLYLESLFDELSTAVKVLFDRRDLASVLWPKHATFDSLLDVLNASDLSNVWGEDETIGWMYQYFNSGDERKKMRDESQAPRNSRELAVRNQFFTPRYVVEFLVDNTLGRTWLEMYGVGSRLAQRCQYFVRSEEEPKRTRPKKDPRDLRILDPACGSGHFLLYSFDLLLVIYEEAWHDAASVPSKVTGRTLREDHPDLADFQRKAPILIVEQNLYGVDIDPRAAQIAAFALWLRAQRAFREWNVPAVERRPLRRTHIVVAEPMPGEEGRVEEFASRLEPPLLGELFRKMVREMRLAGVLGTLIRVEIGITAELDRAREEFAKAHAAWQATLPGFETPRLKGDFNLSGVDDDQFFHEAEGRILSALRKFAESSQGDEGVRRKLFKDDATQGIALIELLRLRFDVALMNPPFGAASVSAKNEFEKVYPRTKNDIYAAFVERGVQLLCPHGLVGAITSRTGFFLSSFQKWREEVLVKEAPPVVFADLGNGVMDAAMVQAAAYCLEKSAKVRAIFLRVLEAENKGAALLSAARELDRPDNLRRFDVDTKTFSNVTRSPFAYWVSDRLRSSLSEMPILETNQRIARVGIQTSDDFRFLRTWWEVPEDALTHRWLAFAKGGAYSPFFSDIYLSVQWTNNGHEMKAWAGSLYNESHWTRILKNTQLMQRPGLTWPARTQGGLSIRAMPAGGIFGHKGPAVIVEHDDIGELTALLAVVNSRAFRAIVDMQMAFGSYEVGVLQRTPLPRLDQQLQMCLGRFARAAWSLKRSLETSIETSHAFRLPALLQVAGVGLGARAAAWSEHVRVVETELARIQAEIDECCFALYDIDETDRRAIISGFSGNDIEAESNDDDGTEESEDHPDEGADESASLDDPVGVGAELVSWAVGTAFGRFDVALAIGSGPTPSEPEPFDPLPPCSPGMLVGDDGLPLAQRPSDYPIAFAESGVLVDDFGHPHDLKVAVSAVFELVFGGESDRWLNDLTAVLDSKGHDLRAWLAESFFEHHLKRYSKSRRKAPIVWQLGTQSGRYSVWLYAHRISRDSFFQLQNDTVGPKLVHEERKLTSLVQSAGVSPSVSERREISVQEDLVEELRKMLDEIKRVAPLWNPNLDDGVVLTMAPLWRLVPQHKSWQKELKSKWDELVAGTYDWAHLAMHLWPERVVPKCVTDRSFAIAHGLEDVFWVEEDTDGKWRQRETPLRPIEELIRERSSPAVKASLKSLLEAPTASSAGRSRKRNGVSTAVARGERR